MASYLRKLHIKAALVFFSVLIFLVLAGIVIVNIYLIKQKNRIKEQVHKNFDIGLSIESMIYLPPDCLCLKNVSISRGAGVNSLISARNVRLRFSAAKLIKCRKLSITDVLLTDINGDSAELAFCFKRYLPRIVDFINSLPGDQNFCLGIKKGKFTGERIQFTVDNGFGVKNKTITSSGNLNFIIGRPNERNIKYKLKAYLTDEGFDLSNLEFSKLNSHARLWGRLKNNILQLNGYSLVNDFYSSYKYSPKTKINPLKKIRAIISGGSFSTHIVGLSSDLNIFDMDCRIKFSLAPASLPGEPEIEIERIKFSLNGVPFILKGDVSFPDAVSINMQLSSYPGQNPQERSANLHAFDIKMQGDISEDKFNGRVWFDFFRKIQGKVISQKTETKIKNLNFNLKRENFVDAHFDEADLSYISDNNPHKLFFKNFTAAFDLTESIKSVKFKSLLYDGVMEGNGILDLSQAPFKNEYDIKITGASAEKLRGLLVYFSKVSGKLDSDFCYKNFPESNLEGTVVITGGCLEDFQFFVWLSKYFGIPSLRQVEFIKIRENFKINGDTVNLQDISLDSADVKAAGFFMIDEDNLVSSNICLKMSKDLLSTSRKFKPLLGIVKSDIASLDFNFRLSGPFEAMNFKWMESDFKNKLQDYIPNFIERKIERMTEDAVNSIKQD